MIIYIFIIVLLSHKVIGLNVIQPTNQLTLTNALRSLKFIKFLDEFNDDTTTIDQIATDRYDDTGTSSENSYYGTASYYSSYSYFTPLDEQLVNQETIYSYDDFNYDRDSTNLYIDSNIEEVEEDLNNMIIYKIKKIPFDINSNTNESKECRLVQFLILSMLLIIIILSIVISRKMMSSSIIDDRIPEKLCTIV